MEARPTPDTAAGRRPAGIQRRHRPRLRVRELHSQRRQHHEDSFRDRRTTDRLIPMKLQLKPTEQLGLPLSWFAAEGEKGSNSRSLIYWDQVPWRVLSHKRGGDVPEIIRRENVRVGKGSEATVEIRPAIMTDHEGKVRRVYPGAREEMVEMVLRRMAVQRLAYCAAEDEHEGPAPSTPSGARTPRRDFQPTGLHQRGVAGDRGAGAALTSCVRQMHDTPTPTVPLTMTAAAKRLRLSRSTLYTWLKKSGLPRASFLPVLARPTRPAASSHAARTIMRRAWADAWKNRPVDIPA